MKTFALLALCVPCATATSFVAQPHVSTALNVRGGGVFGTPVTERNLVDLYSVLCVSHGLVAMAAPKKLPEIFYSGSFSVADAHSSQMTQFLGAALISIAMVVHLSESPSIPFAKVLAYSQIPCIYSFLENLLHGKFSTWRKGGGARILAVETVCTLGILSGKINPDLCVKILIAIPILSGVLGYASTDLITAVTGFPKPTGVAEVTTKWWSLAGLFYGALALGLYQGKGLNKSVGLSALVFLLGLVDGNYIRKHNVPLGKPKVMELVLLATLAATAGGLLIEN